MGGVVLEQGEITVPGDGAVRASHEKGGSPGRTRGMITFGEHQELR